jgi:hypothetical protein
MFLIRSAFWLTVAFIAFHPKDVDLGATANALSNEAVAAGQRTVVSALLRQDCRPLLCAPDSPTTAAMSISLPAAGRVLQAPAIDRDAPFPRPRPAWMG